MPIDEDLIDEDLIDEGIPAVVVDDLDDDENPPVVVVPRQPKPEGDPLESASWKNVLSLMETQNALIERNLSGLRPAIEELQTASQSVKNAVDRVNTALEELNKVKEEAAPDDISTVEEEIAPAAQPERKKGPRWRK